MPEIAISPFLVGREEWPEILFVFEKHRAFQIIATLFHGDNRPLNPNRHEGLTEELAREVNNKLEAIGIPLRLTSSSLRGRFEGIRFRRLKSSPQYGP